MKEKNKIKQYKNNNTLDLEKIISGYTNYIHQIIVNMQTQCLSHEDIEEIISDTFFILWKNRTKLDEEKMLSSYLAGIVRNLVREKKRSIDIQYDITNYQNTIQDLEELDMLYEKREKINIIENVIKEMKQEDIKIFNMYYYYSMKIKEIASFLNLSEYNVKSRLYRIRKNLKKGGYSNEG